MGSGNKGRQQQENSALLAWQRAQAAADAPDPAEAAERQHALDLDKWEYSTDAPIDIYKMPGSGVAIDLFRKAKQAHDAGRIGQGLSYGENANPTFSKAIDKENELTRGLQASGDLENYVSDKLAAKDARLHGVAAMGNARRSSAADRAMQMYMAMIGRPRQESALKQFALGGLGAFGSFAGALPEARLLLV